jgi:hypothetical protein
MKRDMDLIREQLLGVERLDAGTDEGASLDAGEWPPAVFQGHLRLLKEGALIDAHEVPDDEEDFNHYLPVRLTWAGHDFLDAIRDPEVWAKTKQGAEAVRSWSLETLKEIGKGLIKKQIEEYTGVKV